MIHTPNIIETVAQMWRQLIGMHIAEINVSALAGVAEPSEIAISVRSIEVKYYISWMQEDGKSDELLFHWLSIRDSSHFTAGALVPFKIELPTIEKILGAKITSVQLFGDRAHDAVFATLLRTKKGSIGFATTRWLAHKQRFSRFGSEDLALISEQELNSLLDREGLTLVSDIRC
ncbi:hypothetical protein Pan258_38820 [Symmachiella dynata]|nr:hypothetical protein Pan258_38820 [Symmachiella dynata]